MTDVPLYRLYLLRAMYLIIAAGMGVQIWPLLFHHRPWEVMHGVGVSFLAALTLICLAGVRYPLAMLPLLVFEFLWKAIWMLAIALPAVLHHHFDADVRETAFACGLGVVLVPLVLPWPYLFARFVRAPGDRWGRVRGIVQAAAA
ncbi:MAG: hypothetical protein JO157_09190 [Acetobacteraceae bacterium]|nr:hypothetical protein [Acetobacteraceae bacterium]